MRKLTWTDYAILACGTIVWAVLASIILGDA